MKKKIILLIIFLVGIILLLYPIVSHWWNSKVLSRTISNYDKVLNKVNDYSLYFEDAINYNKSLEKLDFPLTQYNEISGYNKLLNINNDGMIGYITIDKLKLKLPIYHGTSSSVLNAFVGHLEGSSLPIGGSSTHSVLSAHRGLPSSKLFTNLNKLVIGDIFSITVLDRVLYYEVDNIVVVKPNEVSYLEIVDGMDYVTLVTCTPYGINTHRLLVRGRRISDIELEDIDITNSSYKIDIKVISLVIFIFILLIVGIYLIIKTRR